MAPMDPVVPIAHDVAGGIAHDSGFAIVALSEPDESLVWHREAPCTIGFEDPWHR